MAHLTGQPRARYVQEMFSRISARYQLMNRLMTAGQDARWRKEAIAHAGLNSGDRLLDIGAGTGDLAHEALRQQPDGHATAADFTLDMMRADQRRGAISWCGGDALALPFKDETFDAVVSGFLLRNVADLDRALREQLRVLKPGGRVVVLDTTRPRPSIFSPLVWLHMHIVIPALGALVSGARAAYTYLPDSTERFVSAEELATCMADAGFRDIGFKLLMAGTIAIHWGKRLA